MAQKTVTLNMSVTADETVMDYCIQAYAEAYGWVSLAESGMTAAAFTAKQIKQNTIADLRRLGAEKAQASKEAELIGFT
jgi:hypothetical protein